MPDTIAFDHFAPEHLDGALRLSLAAGWPHRLADWHLVLSLSRGIVALSGGRVVGTALATPFGPVAMANMIIVDESLRGRGLGRNLMERAMALLSPQEWRLTATADGLPLYRRLGFRETGRVVQLQGPVASVPAPEAVDWAGAEDMAAMLALDLQATGADRGPLLARLAVDGRLARIRDSGVVTGFAATRRFGRGEVIGPVIAQSDSDAKRLLSFMFSGRAGDFLRVDTTETSGLAPWLQGLGLNPAGGGIAMRLGGQGLPPAPFQVFALAAQALG